MVAPLLSKTNGERERGGVGGTKKCIRKHIEIFKKIEEKKVKKKYNNGKNSAFGGSREGGLKEESS